MKNRGINNNQFSLNVANKASKASHYNKAECKVFFNVPFRTQEVEHTQPLEHHEKITERSINLNIENEEMEPFMDDEKINNELINTNKKINKTPSYEFLELLASIFTDLLANNNRKLILNLFDNSGKVIVSGCDLINLISKLTNTDPMKICIIYEEIESGGCFAKIEPMKVINKIKIDERDFELAYNREFNILNDIFRISTSRCLIN